MSAMHFSNAEPGPQPGETPGWDPAALRSGAALRALIQKRRRGPEQAEQAEQLAQPRQTGQPLDLRPGCVYGVITRERVDDLTNELREIKARLNYLFSLVAGAIIVDVLLRISGLG